MKRAQGAVQQLLSAAGAATEKEIQLMERASALSQTIQEFVNTDLHACLAVKIA